VLIFDTPEPDTGLGWGLHLDILEPEPHTAVYYRFGGLIDQCCEVISQLSIDDATSLSMAFTKLRHEIQNEYRGVGDITQSSPARLRDDRFINHTLDKEYAEPPHIILTNMCNAHLFIDNAKTDKGQVTITIGIGAQFEGEEAKYQILAIAKDTP